MSTDGTPPQIRTDVPHSARIWNYWLGGKDNYPVDREIGDEVLELNPVLPVTARASRAFIGRVVRYLAGEAGIRQFLDVGTGLPTADNTHEVAQRVAPQSKIVYVDNDPLVLVHARALLNSTPEGECHYLDADLRDPDSILQAAAGKLNFGSPIALMLMGILGHIDPYTEAREIVSRLVAALPAGSYLASYDGDDTNPLSPAGMRRYAESGAIPYHLRSRAQLAAFFDGLQPVEPGLVSCPLWRPGSSDIGGPPKELNAFGGVARKPQSLDGDGH